jgi:3-deoxy-D-manno-octulosonic-acid transferase
VSNLGHIAAYHAYCAAIYAAAPVVAAVLGARSRYRPLLRRFAPAVPEVHAPPIWLHACSVGEVNAAKPLLRALHERWPEIPVVLTVSTTSGYGLAGELRDCWLHVTLFPFDLPGVARRFVTALQPRVLILLETELWPAVIRETRRRRVPVLMVSGRLSERHLRRYQRARWLFLPVIKDLAAVGVQTKLYAERFEALGVAPSRITITGNVKYSGAVKGAAHTEDLRRLLPWESQAPVLVFGSTRPGDEALAYQCWNQLRHEFPALRLLIAPRHPQRVRDIVALIPEPVTRRTELNATAPGAAKPIVILDTLGELSEFYALATVAVIGGSFYPGVDGHNPFEPAAHGIPTVFGPYMAHFAEPAAMLLERNGALQVQDAAMLAPALAGLLRDAPARAAMAVAARQTVFANQGAIEKTLDLIAQHLPAGSGGGGS